MAADCRIFRQVQQQTCCPGNGSFLVGMGLATCQYILAIMESFNVNEASFLKNTFRKQ